MTNIEPPTVEGEDENEILFEWISKKYSIELLCIVFKSLGKLVYQF